MDANNANGSGGTALLEGDGLMMELVRAYMRKVEDAAPVTYTKEERDDYEKFIKKELQLHEGSSWKKVKDIECDFRFKRVLTSKLSSIAWIYDHTVSPEQSTAWLTNSSTFDLLYVAMVHFNNTMRAKHGDHDKIDPFNFMKS